MISVSEWHYVSLSEERMVSQLIRNRSQLENLKSNQDVMCVLISLDQ